MEASRPSTTAERAASLRALHQILDEPVLLDDPIALRLLSPERAAALRANPGAFDSPGLRALRTFIALRSRYAEDALRAAVARGVGQYVVLGAGLDSFAYRNPLPAGAVRVFEVDHPATQAWKRERLRAAGIELPPSLVFTPVDLERDSPEDALRSSGLDLARPVCIAWLGVTMYLTRDAIRRTLAWVAGLAPGSGIVFEYAVPAASQPESARAFVGALAGRAAALGEPWLSAFTPQEIDGELRALGFASIEDLGSDEAQQRYFRDRSDGLRTGGGARLVHARTRDPSRS